MTPISVHTLADAKSAWEKDQTDLVLLDLMLPIVLSAKSGLSDRISGLDYGADDYLPKPFSVEELLARVRAQLRRGQGSGPTVVKCGDLEVDLFSRRALLAGRLLFLSTTEFRLLELLANHVGHPVSKQQLLEYVWDDPDRDANVVEVYVNYLRNKLERGGAVRLIHTVRGKGYVLQTDPPSA